MLEGAFGDKYLEEVNFKLKIWPLQKAISRQQFEDNAPPYSAGADGYVAARSFDNLDKKIINRDHHEDSHRLSTLWSAGQIWMDVRMGIYQVFRDEHGPRMELNLSSCDEDDSTCAKLLKDPHLVYLDKRRRLEKLIDLMGKMDVTAGCYPVDLSDPDVRSVAWITDPYREFRCSGSLDRKISKEFEDVVDQIGRRIDHYIAGTHKEITPETDYKVLYEEKPVHGQNGWVFIEETGKQARMGAIADGHQAVVTYRPLADGRSAYTICRISPYIQFFDLEDFMKHLNSIDDVTSWGGATDTIIGSPKNVGSKFTPDQLHKILSERISEFRRSGPTDRKSQTVTYPSADPSEISSIKLVG